MFEFDRDKLKKSGLLFGLFVFFTLLVRVIDVKPIGPEDSKVGFAAVNGPVAKLLGYHPFWFNFAEVLGYLSILVCLYFAFKGIKQLLDAQGSFARVDPSYFALGITYLITIAFYEIFNLVPINYRPVIIDAAEGLEASYPSSHTVLSVVVMLTAAIMFRRILPKGDSKKPIILSACYILMILTVLTRLLSGAHWLTDIIGGLILAVAIVSFFDAVRKPEKIQGRAAKQSASKAKGQTSRTKKR